MSKRRKKVEQLPLDSPNWMPVAEALRLLNGLLGNHYLAAKDLFAAAAAKRSDKRLPCMRRLIASEVAPDRTGRLSRRQTPPPAILAGKTPDFSSGARSSKKFGLR